MPFVVAIALATIIGSIGCNRPAAVPAAQEATTPGVSRQDEIRAAVRADVEFLADDALRGRGTGSAELERAGRYLADAFAEAGVMPYEGFDDYLQPVPLVLDGSPRAVSLSFGGDTASQDSGNLLALQRSGFDARGPVRYLGGASADSIAGLSLEGRVVVTVAGGDAIAADLGAYLAAAEAKRKAVAEAGGIALVEIYRAPFAPFGRLTRAFGGERYRVADDPGARYVPAFWLQESPVAERLRAPASSEENVRAALLIEAAPSRPTRVHNVIGVIPGTDPARAKEYIAVTAHYDHIGVTSRPGVTDSINNGARDNGMGTAALLRVARHFAKEPLPRPLLLIGWTAEEQGLLGSAYFVERGGFPLDRIAVNVNFDGAGYDDTTSLVIIGYGRTNVQDLIDVGIARAGLRPMPDPVPQFGLYRQSDNYHMARVGIPAVDLAPGFTGFSGALMQYYHQPADEAATLDWDYVTRYTEAAVYVVEELGRSVRMPSFVDGDEFAGRPR